MLNQLNASLFGNRPVLGVTGQAGEIVFNISIMGQVAQELTPGTSGPAIAELVNVSEINIDKTIGSAPPLAQPVSGGYAPAPAPRKIEGQMW